MDLEKDLQDKKVVSFVAWLRLQAYTCIHNILILN